MVQVTTLNTKTNEEFISVIKDLKVEVMRLREKLEGLPSYGSKEWWQLSNTMALKSISEGRGIKISNKKDLSSFFKSL